jgi:predicted  nucleic acid-binding Zn-ribbon protein
MLDRGSAVATAKETTEGLRAEEDKAEGVRELLATDVKNATELEKYTEPYTSLKKKSEELDANVRQLHKDYLETAERFVRMNSLVKERVSYHTGQFARIDAEVQQRIEVLGKLIQGAEKPVTVFATLLYPEARLTRMRWEEKLAFAKLQTLGAIQLQTGAESQQPQQ